MNACLSNQHVVIVFALEPLFRLTRERQRVQNGHLRSVYLIVCAMFLIHNQVFFHCSSQSRSHVVSRNMRARLLAWIHMAGCTGPLLPALSIWPWTSLPPSIQLFVQWMQTILTGT